MSPIEIEVEEPAESAKYKVRAVEGEEEVEITVGESTATFTLEEASSFLRDIAQANTEIRYKREKDGTD